MPRLLKHLNPSMVVALIALFVALGGVSYAAIRLPASSVGAVQLKTNAVTAAKINKNAVTAVKIASNAVQGAKINTNAVSAAKIASNAVTSAKIAANAVTSAKVADGTLTSADFASGVLPPHGISGLTTVSGTVQGGTGNHSATAACPAGTKALSGGYNTSGISGTPTITITFNAIQADGITYEVDGRISSGTWNLTARVLCAPAS